VRARAVAALVAIGSSSVGSLARLGGEPRGLMWAIRALSQIGGEPAVGPLTQHLGHKTRAVRAEAAKGLVAVGSASVPALLAVAARRDRPLLEAAQALSVLADARAIALLAGLLTHERAAVRSVAAYGLERIGGVATSAAVAALEQSGLCSVEAAQVLSRLSDGSSFAALDRALKSTDAGVRRSAAVGLGRAEPPVVTDNLLGAARDPDRTVRSAAVWALGRLSGDAAAQDVIIEASQDDDPVVGAAVARALYGSRTATAHAVLLRQLRAESPSVRAAAAQSLQGPRESSVAALLGLLDDEAWHVRRAALGSLVGLGWEPATVHEQVLYALGCRDWPLLLAFGATAVDQLGEHLKAWDPRLRRLAAEALTEFGDSALEAASSTLRGGASVPARVGAARVLGAIGGAQALAVLVAAFGEDNAPSVRRSIGRALNRLGDCRGDAEGLASLEELQQEWAVDYVEIRAAAPSPHVGDVIAFLSDVLPQEWAAIYAAQNPHPPNISVVSVAGFDYLFDNPEHLIQAGELDERAAVADRLVAVHGRSGVLHGQRDDSRLRPFPLGPVDPSVGPMRGKYDRGHVMGHALGGGLDINVIPQAAGTNEGSSEDGRRFRSIERYAAEHPGIYCFARPLFAGFAGHPAVLEFGVLKEDGTLWVERFGNVPDEVEAEEIERLYMEKVLKRRGRRSVRSTPE
jgi:HEAT repeat protein